MIVNKSVVIGRVLTTKVKLIPNIFVDTTYINFIPNLFVLINNKCQDSLKGACHSYHVGASRSHDIIVFLSCHVSMMLMLIVSTGLNVKDFKLSTI